MKALVSFVSTLYISFFYVGFVSGGQGTLASIISLPFILSIASVLPPEPSLRMGWVVGIVLILSAFAIPAIVHSNHVPVKDCDQPLIVIDEVIGMLIAASPLLFVQSYSVLHSLGALALFRIFDIWKPLGIAKIDRWNSPYGVVLDDIVAGGFAAAILSAFFVL